MPDLHVRGTKRVRFIQSVASTDTEGKHQDSSLPPFSFSCLSLWSMVLPVSRLGKRTHILPDGTKKRVFKLGFG